MTRKSFGRKHAKFASGRTRGDEKVATMTPFRRTVNGITDTVSFRRDSLMTRESPIKNFIISQTTYSNNCKYL